MLGFLLSKPGNLLMLVTCLVGEGLILLAVIKLFQQAFTMQRILDSHTKAIIGMDKRFDGCSKKCTCIKTVNISTGDKNDK